MDALYIYKHSEHEDFEIRHSLRSIERHMPWIGKVWIYGDRPPFISDDISRIEHVPQEATSRVLGVKTPVTNFFLLMFLSSLIPELSSEYLLFSDDFFILRDCSKADACKNRYIEDMTKKSIRGSGLWFDAIWRTYDALVRLGYSGFNFESHTPTYLTRKWVMDAYCDLKDFATEDRWYGLIGPTAILNHVYTRRKIELTYLIDENTRLGFWGKPPTYEEIVEKSEGKLFFNFDDAAYGEAIERFLKERFPVKSKYEKY